MKYFLSFTIVFVLMSKPSLAQNLNHTDSVIKKLEDLSEIQKIDSLLSLSYFPINDISKANECIVFVREAKRLAFNQNVLDKYAIALELEGLALGALGKREQGIDSVKKSIEIGVKLKNTALIGQGYFSLGTIYEANDDLTYAISSYKLAIEQFNQLENHRSKYIVVNNLASAYFHSGSYTEALTYYLKNVTHNKESNNDIKLAKNYGNLSLVYKALKNYDKANFYVQKAIKLQKELGQYFNLSISYLSAGNIQRRLKQYDSAFYFNREALDISNNLADTIGIAFAYYNIASVYENIKEFTNAIDFYSKSAGIFEKMNFTSKSIACYNNLSLCYIEINDRNTALKYGTKAYKLAKKLNNIPLLEMVTETLYTTYYELNNYKQALVYRDLNVAYKDSLLNQGKVKEIAKIETNYEIKSRDSEIALLNKNQEIAAIKAAESEKVKYYLIIIAFLLLFIIVYIFNRFLVQKKIKLELSKANNQLKELNTSKNKFFAIIAHDLRNPITAFNNLTSALVNNFNNLSKDQLLNYLTNLKKSSGQINGLLENLLQWALSQTETLSLDLKEFDLSHVIQKNIDLLAQNANQKNISFSYDIEIEAVAFADQSTIDIVFRNIIANAIKFSGNESNIKIETKLSGEFVEVSIKDEGIGMTAEEIEMLFDITKDTATIGSSPEKGSGLGLLLCSEYIKKSNGKINVWSEVNEGSTFIIKLPRTQLNAA